MHAKLDFTAQAIYQATQIYEVGLLQTSHFCTNIIENSKLLTITQFSIVSRLSSYQLRARYLRIQIHQIQNQLIINQLIEKNIMEESKKGTSLTAESLLGRFRSKHDIHKYLTQHYNVFLPSFKDTSISFLRDILNEKKAHLKATDAMPIEVLFYQEISVRNIYEDAMADPDLSKYLPSKEQLSNRLPERKFFFGVVGSIKRQYLADIISAAHNHRYKAGEGKDSKQAIQVSESWSAELMKHPFVSKKKGTVIFLLKERSKLRRIQTERSKFEVVKRLSCQISGASDALMSQPRPEKRLKHPPQQVLPGFGQNK